MKTATVEQRHYRFKQAADQALMMRGSRDFPAMAAYQMFLAQAVCALECRPAGTLSGGGGQAAVGFLSSGLIQCGGNRVRVSPGSLVTVHRNYYSVHSRLIGEVVEARVAGRHGRDLVWRSESSKQLPRLAR